MELLYKNEHLACQHYCHSEKPDIEVVKILAGDKGNLLITENEIVCVVEGHIRYDFHDMATCEGLEGTILFRRARAEYAYEVLTDSMIVIFRINKPINLCNNYSIEKLYRMKEEQPENITTAEKKLATLEMNERVWHFLQGVIGCITDGIKCNYWFELKIKELFTLLRGYYTKELLFDFFNSILSPDMAFSEYVHMNWLQFRSVNKLAASMNMTPKQFSARFISIFGQTPYRWILDNKAKIAYQEITSTKLPFKQIALDNGFNSDTQFTRFCKEKFGNTPTELRLGKR